MLALFSHSSVEYLKAKIMTYRGHRKAMETKHHDLLIRLTEMERDWDEEGKQGVPF